MATLLVTTIFLLQAIGCFGKTCPTEYSRIRNFKNKAKWSASTNNQIVISQPPCFSFAGELLTRTCHNGRWYPPELPQCYSTSLNQCPGNLIFIQDHCVYVTKPETWNMNYRYENKIKDLTARNLNKSDSFWLPMRRNTKYGPFEYMEIGEDYRSPINMNLSSEEFFSGDCIIYNTNTKELRPEDCEALHPSVRKLRKDSVFYHCPKGCEPVGFASLQCYCKNFGKSCEALAKIDGFFTKKVLTKFIGSDICKVSPPESSNSSESYLNGSYWQAGVATTNCSICERRAIATPEPKMVLTFEEDLRKLYLVVYWPQSIIRDKNGHNAIYCFTNAAKEIREKKMNLKLTSTEDSLIAFEVKMKNYMGNYFCIAEIFGEAQRTITSNTVVAYKKRRGNEFALRLIIKSINCSYSELDTATEDLIDQIEIALEDFNAEVRPMETFNCSSGEQDFLLHISTGKRSLLSWEFPEVLERLQNFNKTEIKIIYFRSSERCLSEITKRSDYDLTWPLSRIGYAVVPREFCLDQRHIPVSRMCSGSFLYGATWSEIKGDCRTSTGSAITQLLKNISEVENPEIYIEEIREREGTFWNLTVLDIWYHSTILNRLRKYNPVLTVDYMSLFIENLIRTNREVLKEAHYLFNLTDIVLDLTETVLTEFSRVSDPVYLIQAPNFIIHVTNPFLSNFSGLFLHGPSNSNLDELVVTDFERNSLLDPSGSDDLQLAVFVPEVVLEQILNETFVNISDVVIITTIYVNDSLFVNQDFKSTSYIVGVTIPAFGSYLRSPVSTIFRSKTNQSQICGFWDNGRKTGRKKGEWSSLGGTYLGTLNESFLHRCSYVHLTHFALLLVSDIVEVEDGNETVTLLPLDDSNEFILQIITIVGGCLSVASIIGIFLTAYLFEKWRNKPGTKILMHLSVAILSQIVCIHLSEIRSFRESEQTCKIIGMIAHFTVISKFSWMSIYAFLQYLRFVKVVGPPPRNLLLKSVLVGWGLPFLMVLLVGTITSRSYVSSSYEICYPRGMLLYVWVLLPVFLIVIGNLTIYCIIMYQVSHSKVQRYGSYNDVKLRVYLGLLLFFVLGLPWIFGILAELVQNLFLKMVLFYIFCITAILEGTILFLFYVVLNKETRNYWVKFYKNRKSS